MPLWGSKILWLIIVQVIFNFCQASITDCADVWTNILSFFLETFRLLHLWKSFTLLGCFLAVTNCVHLKESKLFPNSHFRRNSICWSTSDLVKDGMLIVHSTGGINVMSSNLGATLGHCILLHAKEYYKCFRKGGMKGNSYAFIGKERLAIGCCAAVIPVQIFAADLMVYHLMK